MRKPRLTQRAIAALIAVAQEFEAGHSSEMAEEASVAEEGKGDEFMDALEQGIKALIARQRP